MVRPSSSAIAVRRSLSVLRAVSIAPRICLQLEFAFGQQARLFGEARLQILRATAEHFGFGGLRDQLLLELGDAAAEIFDLAAFFREFLCCRACNSTRSASRRSSTVLSSLLAPSRRSFSASTCVLSATISTFCASAMRERSSSSPRSAGEFGFLVGQRALGFVHRAGLDREFFFGRAQLVAQRLVARFERENGGGLFAELDLEPVDGVALLAEFGELAGAPAP